MGFVVGLVMVKYHGGPWGTPWENLAREISHGMPHGPCNDIPHMIASWGVRCDSPWYGACHGKHHGGPRGTPWRVFDPWDIPWGVPWNSSWYGACHGKHHGGPRDTTWRVLVPWDILRESAWHVPWHTPYELVPMNNTMKRAVGCTVVRPKGNPMGHFPHGMHHAIHHATMNYVMAPVHLP